MTNDTDISYVIKLSIHFSLNCQVTIYAPVKVNPVPPPSTPKDSDGEKVYWSESPQTKSLFLLFVVSE